MDESGFGIDPNLFIESEKTIDMRPYVLDEEDIQAATLYRGQRLEANPDVSRPFVDKYLERLELHYQMFREDNPELGFNTAQEMVKSIQRYSQYFSEERTINAQYPRAEIIPYDYGRRFLIDMVIENREFMSRYPAEQQNAIHDFMTNLMPYYNPPVGFGHAWKCWKEYIWQQPGINRISLISELTFFARLHRLLIGLLLHDKTVIEEVAPEDSNTSSLLDSWNKYFDVDARSKYISGDSLLNPAFVRVFPHDLVPSEIDVYLRKRGEVFSSSRSKAMSDKLIAKTDTEAGQKAFDFIESEIYSSEHRDQVN